MIIWPANESDLRPDRPCLHALVIGVASYPHLNGGTGRRASDPLMLGQVTTPTHTARAIAAWLMQRYANPQCPLGTVDLLVSDGTAGQPSEAPTMGNIERAVTAWTRRAAEHPNNIAFLYFCGHGLAKEDLYLLPEDFGDPQWSSQWRNCIDFDGLRLGLWASCKAETQVLFVDACRETPFGMLTHINVQGQPLIGGQGFGSNVKTQAIYFATTEGKQAYGPANSVSYFGQAVLNCLDGLATSNTQGTWVVDTHGLSGALGRLVQHMAETSGQPLLSEQVVKGRIAILHMPAKPRVIAQIRCSHDRATAAADIELRRADESYKSSRNDPKPLVAEVDPGDWEVVVSFAQGEYPTSGPLDCMLIPPIYTGVPYP